MNSLEHISTSTIEIDQAPFMETLNRIYHDLLEPNVKSQIFWTSCKQRSHLPKTNVAPTKRDISHSVSWSKGLRLAPRVSFVVSASKTDERCENQGRNENQVIHGDPDSHGSNQFDDFLLRFLIGPRFFGTYSP